MLADEGLLCKCHKPVTRHRSRAQRSYGAFYYKCYKAFTPGCCDFFGNISYLTEVEVSLTCALRKITEWEQLPSPPPSPVIYPTRRDGNQEPTTPPRRRMAAPSMTGNPAVDSPRRIASIKEGLLNSFRDEGAEQAGQGYVTASSTPFVTPRKRATAPTSAMKRTLFSDSPTKSSPFSQSGERALVRAATEGDLGSSLSREELLRLLEIKERQLEAEKDTVKALQKQLEAARAEKDFFGPDSPVSLNLPSPSKGKGKALDFSSPPRMHHHQSIIIPEPTPESSTTVQSHFSMRSPAKSASGDRPAMWN